MHFVCPSLDTCYPQEMLSFLSGQAASVLYLWCSTLTPSSSSYWSYSTEHLGAAQQRFNSWGGDNYTWCTSSPRYKPNRFSAGIKRMFTLVAYQTEQPILGSRAEFHFQMRFVFVSQIGRSWPFIRPTGEMFCESNNWMNGWERTADAGKTDSAFSP